MSTSLEDKALRFRQLHEGQETFVIPNPWDAGSARALEKMGYLALATSSGAAAAMLGRRDGQISRDESLAHAKAIVDAVGIPVAADLEHGFADAPEDVAETIRLAVGIGLAGGSIEDAGEGTDKSLYSLAQATDRIAAAAEALRSMSTPFVLTARAENFLRGNPDLDDTIRRLQAYAAAGADVLFAPGLPTLDAVRTVVQALGDKPLNFMVGIKGKSFSVAELQEAGVRRISLATSLYRAAMAGFQRAALEVKEKGTFGYLDTM